MRSVYSPLFILLAFSCSSDLEVLSIEREKYVNIYHPEFGLIETQDAQIIIGPPEWRLNPEGPPDYKYFKRVTFIMTARGGDPPRDIWLSFTISVPDENQMTGTYNSSPGFEKPGLSVLAAQMVISNGSNPELLWSSSQCEALYPNMQQFPGVTVTIERQSVSERLAAGFFSLSLCNSDSVFSVSGYFKDIPY
ncbi:MAG: hypothetical protein KatS3mg032_0261 [Cyclobacteriaceae bacterium]|nr:MAG: hypothetical protein KatS3mg032_0261 [Cyclobacteriaceae bacterium]